MLGFSREEFMSTPILEFVHPDDLDSTEVDVNKIVSEGGSYDHVNRYRHKNGGYRWLSWRSHYDKQNKHIFGVARDVTREKEVEDALARQEKMYRSLIEHSEDIISRFNRDLQIVYTNLVANRYTTVHPDMMNGKTMAELPFPPEIPSNITPMVSEVFATGKSRTVTFEAASEIGNVIFHVHAFPEFSDQDEVEFVSTVARDITVMRRAEEEQQKIQNLSSLGILAGGIAHDFNNILTILFGNITFAQTLAENGVDCSETLEKASQALKRATSLSTQLLTFAKGGDPVRTDVSLKELLKELVAYDLSGSNVNAVFDIADDLWMADVDMSLISQVFSNLAINADQAMPQGGSIYLSARNIQIDDYDDYQMLLPGKYLEFVFRDEGTGIPASIREKVFDPYFTTKENGNGLGLATVYSIIKKHGGNILVESEVNVGTRFTFYLPASDILPKEKEPSMQKETLAHPGTGRILVMDDEPMILELVEKLLQSRGYDVVGCEDGREAITLYRESMAKGVTFDVVIMDLTIPGGMGGGEAIDALLDFDPQVKAVVSSGYASNDILSNYRDYGFVDYLPKPFTMDGLMAVVQRHCASV
jgi:PAS domain S-box-containing protein